MLLFRLLRCVFIAESMFDGHKFQFVIQLVHTEIDNVAVDTSCNARCPVITVKSPSSVSLAAFYLSLDCVCIIAFVSVALLLW